MTQQDYPPDFRTLCAELVDCLEKANWPLRHKTVFGICLDNARAALAQPEPQEPTDEEITEWADAATEIPQEALDPEVFGWRRCFGEKEFADTIRAALARWAQ